MDGEVSIWVNRVLDMGAPKLMEEFRELSKWKPESMTTKAFLENRPLNRYVDVPCQDARRVILKWPGIDNDYIHANYVATPSRDHHFICTQANRNDVIGLIETKRYRPRNTTLDTREGLFFGICEKRGASEVSVFISTNLVKVFDSSKQLTT
ncbi:hypothetical protein ANCDUO_11002 [Ancylostoma duodenale]|uniref:Tyrosine-protein phosphatase domain-containing protein n=1 Tax=Ancylostoma duodenale TaxID=51022 RepID=A0A0C2GIT8_9BILA|nr:hypothetical protein ANCDUO_11002 [Ancylostoma duodenale]